MAVPAIPLRRTPVLADLVPGAFVRDVALIAGGAGLTGLAAQLAFHIPGTPVPVSGQTFAALLVAAALGPWRAIGALGLYLVAGVAGVPWFTGHASGAWGASFGYIIGFVLAGAAVGALARHGGDRTPLRTVATMGLGTLLIYAVGVPWLAVSVHTSLSHAVTLGVRPFLAGDALKVLAAAGLLPATWRLLGRTGLTRD
ncbi:MAG TPA: biotin transporter BioY [Mycobacteriales bacterium]|nr:biotin transporter BioY [Mycobacteriales bacterium]